MQYGVASSQPVSNSKAKRDKQLSPSRCRRSLNSRLGNVLGRFSHLPHTAPGPRLKSAAILHQKHSGETPTIISTDFTGPLPFQNKYLEPLVTVCDYHTSYVTRHNRQVAFLAVGNLQRDRKSFSTLVHVLVFDPRRI